MNKYYKNLICIVLAVLLLVTPAIAAGGTDAGNGTIYISTAEDLIKLSEDCSLDVWSLGKRVILTDDISLAGVDFEPIPSFSGSFDGAGHTISGLNITGSYSPAGLFCHVGENAIIKDLNVSGIVTPSGSRELTGGIAGVNEGKLLRCSFTGIVSAKIKVGGIVGENHLSGEIYDCTVDGSISGESMTGGIVGNNSSTIVGCTNRAEINTNNIDPSLSLDDINLEFGDIGSTDILGTMNVSSDTGGIAGSSNGMIMSCTNDGAVGYNHVGYNVGGIAGSSGGYISNCVNNGEIKGRKDIGGIIGQSEPYVALNITESNMTKLKSQLDELNDLVDKAVVDASNSSDQVISRLSRLNEYLDSANGTVKKLENQASDWADDTTKEINRMGTVFADSAGRLTNISDKAVTMSDKLSSGIDSLSAAIDQLAEVSAMGADAFSELSLACDDAVLAVGEFRSETTKLCDGIDKLRDAFEISDRDGVKRALDDICDSFEAIAADSVEFGGALEKLIKVMRNSGWTNDAVGGLRSLANQITQIGSEMSRIGRNIGNIADNIYINWDALNSGTNDIISSLDSFAAASDKLDEAARLAQSGLSKISEGIKLLAGSVAVEDEVGARDAMQLVSDGLGELRSALDKLKNAADEAGRILDGMTTKPDADETEALQAAFDDMVSAASEASSAMMKIQDGFDKLMTCIKIDPGTADEGAQLIIDGFDELSQALGQLKSANTQLKGGLERLRTGLGQLRDAAQIKDITTVRSSLTAIYNSLDAIGDMISDSGYAVYRIADALSDMVIWGDNVAAEAQSIAKIIQNTAASIDKLANGVTMIRDRISVDFDLADAGVDLIDSAAREMIRSAQSIESSITHIGEGLSGFEAMSDELSAAVNSVGGSMDIFKAAADSLTDTFSEIESLFAYLAGVEPIQIESPGKSLEASANELYAQMSGISKQLSLLTSDASGTVGTISGDLLRINDKFDEVIDTVAEIFNQRNDMSIENIFTDVSDEAIESATDGKAADSRNYGRVNGDINVGGIVGSMSIEYDLDPEDDISGGSSILNRVYETRAIISHCQNFGDIISKKDCAGGICGRMDLGIITASEGYGKISSESGDYVGGIVGLSSSKIRNCYAKCFLSGGSYIGGIVGSGNSNSLTGSDCVVSDCRTIVEINGSEQFCGAISGCENGKFNNNFFVSDTLRGIDRVSRAGAAERVEYSEFVGYTDIPNEFKHFTLTFIADDEVLKTLEFNYGDSFGKDIYPNAPKKDGFYSTWTHDTFDELHFDTEVEAMYTRYTTALPTIESRSDGRPVFFVQGEFRGSDAVNANAQVIDREAFGDFADGVIDAVSKFFGFIGDGKLPPSKLGREVIEQWQLRIPDDGNETHRVRVLVPEDSGKLSIYVKADSEWECADIETEGSYIVFETSGRVVDLAIVSTIAIWWIWIVIAAVILLIVFLVVRIVLSVRKRRRIKAAAIVETVEVLPDNNAAHDAEVVQDEEAVEASESVTVTEAENSDTDIDVQRNSDGSRQLSLYDERNELRRRAMEAEARIVELNERNERERREALENARAEKERTDNELAKLRELIENERMEREQLRSQLDDMKHTGLFGRRKK
ncbi:MAG: hypothetical protein HFE63_01565 [Clostridiales bacterium]|nr:hypothetical protein [Clostridiales bacterium]